MKKYNIPRQRVVIKTKLYTGIDDEGGQTPLHLAQNNDGPWVNRVGLSRKKIMDAVDESVKRLGTYIDVLYIHRLDRQTPREEIMRALNDVVESGKVRYIGASSVCSTLVVLLDCSFSNFVQMRAWEFQALQNVAIQNNWHKFIVMQSYYSLIGREEEREMIPYCKDAGIGLVPWSPLARGVLARPWATRDSNRETTDIAMKLLVRMRESEADKAIVDQVEKIAKAKGVSMAQVAIAWLHYHGTFPALGLNSPERIDEAVGALQVKLTEEEVKELEEPYLPKGLALIEI